MRLVMRPLFDAPLPPEFIEVLREKLSGREVEEGETVEIELLGKRLPFRVIHAEPSPLRVGRGTVIEITREEISSVTLELEGDIRDVVPFEEGFVVVLENRVIAVDGKGHRLFERTFEGLKYVRATKKAVAVVHDGGLTVIGLE
ncbi:DUF6849 domain-containing protein [Palaeococcus ferrophilus]|uniref:DUF6849 domain-containing protein n=1 Tax=Palaeococcus ferrophilus TaxID=83868 RepID=UPI00064FE1DA|nr:ATPase [Palaeococcus ferrophilus]